MTAPRVQYVTTPDGYSIAYGVSGSGPPLVLLSAPFSHVQLSWEHPTHQPLLQALAERFMLVQYDSRGQGMSTRGLTPERISMEHLCLDLETVIAKLGLEEVVLLGGGYIGHAGILYAARHPGRVKALAVTHCGPFAEAYPLALFNAVALEDWDVFLHNILPRGLTGPEREAGMRRLRQTVSQADFATYIAAVHHYDGRPQLAQLRTPTLILHAREFPNFPVEESVKLASQIAGSQFVLVPGATIYGETSATVDAIAGFLAALPEAVLQERLSPRETEVLRLIAAGKSNQQIADELVLSPRTVERHITNLYAKIGAHGKADATAYALRHGLE